ncbi:MAG: META domain-containing protein [Nocardioidaceae bacterium]|nr:META domain-containing protein [Nocardioidaceae bacterium]
MMKRTIRYVGCSILLIGATSACAGDDGAEPSATSEPTQQAPSPSLADLSGRVFRSSDLPESVPGSVPADVVVTMRFDKRGIVVADTGCNKLTGSARVKGGQLSVSQFAGTEIACDGSELAEGWLSDLLLSEPDVALSQGRLVVDNGEVKLTLDEQGS